MNIQSTLVTMAQHQALGYLQDRIFGGDETLDGPESLFEMLLATLMKSLSGAVGSPASGPGGSLLKLKGPNAKEGHHPIPEYMCGNDKQVDLVNFSIPDHKQLHREMIQFDRAITVGAVAYNVLFRTRRPWDIGGKSPVNKLARTWKGRTAITVGLGVFYSENEWFHKGKGAVTMAPIGVVLGFEAPEFILKNHKYDKSIACKKKH